MRTSKTEVFQPPDLRRDSRRDWAIAGAIFVVALIARSIFLFGSPDRDWPHSVFYEGDAIRWVEWATAIDRGERYLEALPIHPPGVAYPIAFLYAGVHQHGFVGMKVLWCVLSAAACGLTYLACVGARMPRRVGVIAALLLCFSFGQYVLATSLNSEAPYVLLLVTIVLLTQLTIAQPTRWGIAGLGICHGLAMLLRAEHPLMMVMFLGWMFVSQARVGGIPSRRTRLIAPAGVTLVALLTCLPWSVHATHATNRYNNRLRGVGAASTQDAAGNWSIAFNLAPVEWKPDARTVIDALPAFARESSVLDISRWAQRQRLAYIDAADVAQFFQQSFGWTPTRLKSPVLVSNQGQFSFALANHPLADGGFSRIALAHPLIGADPDFMFAFPPHNRIFNDGWREGWESIIDDPPAWLRLVGRKFQRFADGMSLGFGAANLPLGREGVRHRVDMLTVSGTVARVWQIAMLAMIVAGAVLALTRRIHVGLWLLIIVNKIIITLLFYGYARQAASIAPAFFVLIAIAIDSLLLPIDRRWPTWARWQRTIAVGMCMALLALDVVFARGAEKDRIVIGPVEQRPDLGQGAFASYGEIEIRDAP